MKMKLTRRMTLSALMVLLISMTGCRGSAGVGDTEVVGEEIPQDKAGGGISQTETAEDISQDETMAETLENQKPEIQTEQVKPNSEMQNSGKRVVSSSL